MEDCKKYIKEINRLHNDLSVLYGGYKAMQMITNAQDNEMIEYTMKEAKKRLDVLDIEFKKEDDATEND